MKKLIIFIFLFSFYAAACNSSNTQKNTTEVKSDTTNSRIVAAFYQCPMDCESGKTYADTGKCPVCEMDLEKK